MIIDNGFKTFAGMGSLFKKENKDAGFKKF
jgi:hypothetical protein